MKSKMMLVLAVLMSLTGLFTTSVQAQSICDNEVGTQGGYTYEYWKDNGTGCMILGDGGTFSIDWSNINNLLARKGLRPGSKSQVVNYSANYQPNGNSYLCVYGWTTSPLVEYYIVESWGTWRPPGATSKGTITVDGGTYDVYETTRTQQPSIEGTATFQQYWSVRTSKKTSGTIHVGQHFDAWASMGMSMGSLYEVSFCVEGYQSSGSCDVTSMTMTLGDDDDGDDDDDDDGDDDDDDDDDGTYTQVTVPFTQDGAGTYKWMVSSIPSYVNSWNMDSVTINGVDYTNTWVSASNLPAKQNGYYYIDYKASFAWSHLEVR